MLKLHDSVASIGHLDIDTVALHAKASVTCLAQLLYAKEAPQMAKMSPVV